jgi:hypothetical protein
MLGVKCWSCRCPAGSVSSQTVFSGPAPITFLLNPLCRAIKIGAWRIKGTRRCSSPWHSSSQSSRCIAQWALANQHETKHMCSGTSKYCFSSAVPPARSLPLLPEPARRGSTRDQHRGLQCPCKHKKMHMCKNSGHFCMSGPPTHRRSAAAHVRHRCRWRR